MARANRWIAGPLAVLFAVAGWGCGDGPPPVESSKEEVGVKGTVTIRGKPAAGGQITFDPSNIARKDAPFYSAKIAPVGTYALKTLIGENVVSVQGPQIDKIPALASNELRVVVPRGENTIPVDLK